METLTVPGTAGIATLAFPLDSAVEISCGGDRAVLEAWDLALIPAGENLTLNLVGAGENLTLNLVGSAVARTAAIFLANLPE